MKKVIALVLTAIFAFPTIATIGQDAPKKEDNLTYIGRSETTAFFVDNKDVKREGASVMFVYAEIEIASDGERGMKLDDKNHTFFLFAAECNDRKIVLFGYAETRNGVKKVFENPEPEMVPIPIGSAVEEAVNKVCTTHVGVLI
jgi:hypothetical protein